MEEMINANNTSVRVPERKGLLGSSRSRREDDIRLDLREIGYI
jgi:hypothetical protein